MIYSLRYSRITAYSYFLIVCILGPYAFGVAFTRRRHLFGSGSMVQDLQGGTKLRHGAD